MPDKKPRRTAPHIKMRRLSETEWWDEFTAELLAFVLSGPTRSWTEIRAWARARQYTDPTLDNMMAYLDLSKKLAYVSGSKTHAVWGDAPPPIDCAACRAEKETGGEVRNTTLHSCERGQVQEAS